MEIDDPSTATTNGESSFTSPTTSITNDSSNNNIDNDPIVGLDVGGTLFYFYCPFWSIIRAVPTFNTGFLETLMPVSHTSMNVGRNVYFVDRSPTRFEYVRDYIVTLQLHLPKNNDLSLRRALREEAAYFGMPGIMELLQVSHVEHPNLSNQGILYWLGTRRRTTAYANPHGMGAIFVGGWVDDKDQYYDATTMARTPSSYFDFAATHKTRENFVGYRTPVRIDTETYLIKHVSFLMSCEHGGARLPVVIDLKNIQVRPTHYSLRASKCKGMEGDWDFEASPDAVQWDTLHASRGDNNLLLSDHAPGRRTSAEAFLQEAMQEFVYNEEEALDAVISFLELHCRHTWTLDPPPEKFYRFFRIIGASEIGTDSCLHGDGLELYGEVHEE